MTIPIRQLTWLLGGLLLGIALVLGFMPVKATGIGCGTALTGQSDDAFVSDLTSSMMGRLTDNRSACSDAVASRRTVTFALGIPGAVLLLIGAAGLANSAIGRWEERNA